MDKSIEGKSGESFRVVVEEGKIREFAKATKSADLAYGIGAGMPMPSTSPVTFLASSAFWQGPQNSPWSDVDLNLERILHGEQEFVFCGPPPAPGAVLTAKTRIDRVYTKEGKRGGGMTLAETVTEYLDEWGHLVAESRSTVIETSQAPS